VSFFSEKAKSYLKTIGESEGESKKALLIVSYRDFILSLRKLKIAGLFLV
jgi:hypothetical protein